MNLQSLITHYLDTAQQLQLATSLNNKPWCVTVYFAHDNLYNLYWLSMADTRHSQELLINPQVAGAIISAQNYGQPAIGLSVEGHARLIETNAEIEQHFEAYGERYNCHGRVQSIIDGSDGHKLYQLVPERFVLFDQVSFPNQPRQIWELTTIQTI